jgi:integrase/recombinase XerD
LTFNDIEGEHYGACPLGHAKLDTTALYTRVATNTIREVMSPLDRLTPLAPKNNEPRDKPPA